MKLPTLNWQQAVKLANTPPYAVHLFWARNTSRDVDGKPGWGWQSNPVNATDIGCDQSEDQEYLPIWNPEVLLQAEVCTVWHDPFDTVEDIIEALKHVQPGDTFTILR